MAKPAKVSAQRAKEIVEKAAQEAGEVAFPTSDPMKKPKQINAASKEAVAKLVESGNADTVVPFLKSSCKPAVSGLYKSWFMKVIREQLKGGGTSGATAVPPAAAPSLKAASKEASKEGAKAGKSAAAAASASAKTAAAAAKSAEEASKDKKPAVSPEKKKRKKVVASSSEGSDSDSDSSDGRDKEKPAAKKAATADGK